MPCQHLRPSSGGNIQSKLIQSGDDGYLINELGGNLPPAQDARPVAGGGGGLPDPPPPPARPRGSWPDLDPPPPARPILATGLDALWQPLMSKLLLV